MSHSIVFDIVPSPLGPLLVAASERGVCRVAFAEAEDEGAALLVRELPFAHLERDPVAVKPFVERLLAYLDGDTDRLELPLDVSPSRFQARVWDALRRIPRGETRSYSELAAELAVPGGARAVAGACAANPVAVAIPCHRVVAADGGLAGYRWGLARKRALLAREGAAGFRDAVPSSSGRSASAAR